MKNSWIIFLLLLFSVTIKAQNDSLNRLVNYCFNELPVHDSFERILSVIKSDTANYHGFDTTWDDYAYEVRNYEILGEKQEVNLFIYTDADTESIFPPHPQINMAVYFSSEAECDHYFKLAQEQFSMFLVKKKVKTEKRPLLGYYVTYEFYDKNNKLILSIDKDWPFDMFYQYIVSISFYK